MRRSLSACARTGVLVLLIATVGGTAPAQAHTSACFGTGQLMWSGSAFSLAIGAGSGVGGCVATNGISPFVAVGSLYGVCGLATGSASAHDGSHTAGAFVEWRGTTLTFVGGFEGVFHVSTPFVPGCTSGTFLVSGGSVLP